MIIRKPDFRRLHTVLTRRGEPDVLPFYEFFADDVVARRVTGLRDRVDAHIGFFLKMGFDYAPVYTDFAYDRFTLESGGVGDFAARTFVDDNKGIIEDRAAFDRYPWPEIDDRVTRYVVEASGKVPDGMKLIYLTPAGILENVMWLMGYLPFSYALMDDEQLVWDLFERIGQNHLAIMRRCLEAADRGKLGAVAMGDDMGFSHSTMISPEHLRKYVFPWQKKLVSLAHDYDLPFILHACGNLEGVMDDLIDDVGIDAKHSFEDKIMPIAAACDRYKHRIALLGGVDMDFLSSKRPDEVADYTRSVILHCAPGGGYALGSGNSVTDYIPPENYQAMLRTGLQYGTYPIAR